MWWGLEECGGGLEECGGGLEECGRGLLTSSSCVSR